MIAFRDGYCPEWIDQILEVHNKTELKRSLSKKESIDQAFQSSFAVVTIWSDNRIIGCGRMISDGEMYSGIFDVVVDPEFQKQGLGRQIVDRLIQKAPETCIHLTSTFGNEDFYKKLGFRKHKTAFALYPKSLSNSPYLEHLDAVSGFSKEL